MLRLRRIERRSPGHYPVAGKYTKGVQTDVSYILLRKLDNRLASIKQSSCLFVGRLLVSVPIATDMFASPFFTK